MQGLRSISALFWASEKAGVRQPILISSPFVIALFISRKNGTLWGRLKRSARAVQLFGRLAVLETHTLRY